MSFLASKIPSKAVTVYYEIKDFRSTDDTLLASCDADWKEVANKLIVGVNKDFIKNINTIVDDAEIEKKRAIERCTLVWKGIEYAYQQCMLTDKKLVFQSASSYSDKNDTIDSYIMCHFCDAAKSKGYHPQVLRSDVVTVTSGNRISFTLTCDFN